MNMWKPSFTRVRKNSPTVRARSRVRRTRRSRAGQRRLRFMWVLGVIGLMTMGGWGYVKMAPMVSAWTTLQQITVLGLDRIRREEVVGLLNLPDGVSLVGLDTDPLIEQLKRHPWISAASVERVFPDTLAIKITERQPVAILQSPQGVHLLDIEGYLLSAIPAHPLPSLPIVQGINPSAFQREGKSVREQAKKAIQFANVLTGELEGIPTVKVTPQSTFVADVPEARIHIGPSFDDQWLRFRALFPLIQDRMRSRPKEIDLRFAGKVILRERE